MGDAPSSSGRLHVLRGLDDTPTAFPGLRLPACFTSSGTTRTTKGDSPSVLQGHRATKHARGCPPTRNSSGLLKRRVTSKAMTLYYERQGWGTYTTDQEWDTKTYAEHGWE